MTDERMLVLGLVLLLVGIVLLFIPIICFAGAALAVVGFVMLLVGAVSTGPHPGFLYAPPYMPPPAYPVAPAPTMPGPAVPGMPGQPYAAAGTPHCPRCGRPLEYVYQYQRWYCRAENVYPWG